METGYKSFNIHLFLNKAYDYNIGFETAVKTLKLTTLIFVSQISRSAGLLQQMLLFLQRLLLLQLTACLTNYGAINTLDCLESLTRLPLTASAPHSQDASSFPALLAPANVGFDSRRNISKATLRILDVAGRSRPKLVTANFLGKTTRP